MNKDEILNKIIKLETELSETKTQSQQLKINANNEKEQVEVQRKVYDEIRAQLDKAAELVQKAADQYNGTRSLIVDLDRKSRYYTDDLSKLRRELSRLQDTERLQAEYQAKLDEFKEACLNAYWRKENRTDGLGALEHQIDGAIHLAVAKRALLGDKRGLGKSLTSLIYADLMDAQRIILICPSDTMDNFIREIQLWTPHRQVIKIGKMSKAERDFTLPALKSVPQFVVVLNYGAWRKDPELITDLNALKADTVIYDEAHNAKTLSTLAAKGIHNLVFANNTCPSCRPELANVEIDENDGKCLDCGHTGFITDFSTVTNVLPMTGTPILNRPQELFPHLRLIDPENFVSEKLYLRDFCTKDYTGRWKWQYGADEQLVKKIGARYVARDRKAAGIIIPPATPIEHLITKEEFKENYPKQYEAYEQVRKYAQLVLDPEQGIAMAMPYMIVVLMRLRQCLTWPAGIVLKRKDPETEIEYVVGRLEVYQSAKLDKAYELISEINDEEESTLAFSMFKDPMYELQSRLGRRSLAYTGDTDDYTKNQAQLDFDPKTAPPNPKWDNLLGTYGAMGTGLNLNRATHAVLLDNAWNPGTEEQAEGRIDRLGTTKDTYIHRIVVEGTIDTWMSTLVKEKKNIIDNFEDQADLYQEVYRALKAGEI